MKERKKRSLGTLLFRLYLLSAAAFFICVHTAHPLLVDRGLGSSRFLTGAVTLKAIFVSEENAPWTAGDIALGQQRLQDAARQLEQDAAAYGASLSILVECYQAAAPAPFDRDNSAPWARQVINSTPQLPHASYFTYRDTPVLFLLNTPGRAFARTSLLPQLEYAVIFRDDTESVIRHELLHLYGAEDYYVHSDVKSAARTICPDSIMLSTQGTASMDSLSAYLVGWTDEKDESARRMLQETQHVTMSDFRAARSQDQFDGYATVSRDLYTYTGELLDGNPHGQGTALWIDGAVYEGSWRSGLYHGQGTLTWANGDCYTGTFANGMPNGHGTISWSSGTVYSGDFVGFEPHGKGTFSWPGGASYTGSVVHGVRTGWGMYAWSNGDVYTGEFMNGAITGQGVIRFSSGDVYSGSFLDGRLHGPGCYTHADGSQRIGRWEHSAYVTGSADE